MKKKLLSAILVLVLCLAPAVQTASAASTAEAQAFSAMMALKDQYPEGMSWTNDNFYRWKGGVYSGGYGCAGFAFLLSDAAFGDLPARVLTSFDYSDVRVGDILRVNGDTHSVIVLEVRPDQIVIAEGNYNYSIHWGRVMTKNEVMQADYLMTRWPEVQPEPEPEPQPEPEKPLAKAGNQNIEIDGVPVAFQTYMLADENGNGTNYVKLRDIAHVLNGTPAQFSVGYNRQEQSISASTGAAYKDTGTEMDTPFAGADKEYAQSDLTIVVDGKTVRLDAITLMDDAGNGYNYFKLRDLGEALGFTVGYSRARGVYVETGASSAPVTAGSKDIEVTTNVTQYGTGYYVADNGFGTGKLNNGKPITEANVLELLAEAEKIWPTGMTWREPNTYNNNWYEWSGSVVDSIILSKYRESTNYACGGFASMVSDYVFGQTNNPFHRVYDEKDLRPGDIVVKLTDNKPTHVAFVTEANNGAICTGDGNINGLVSWERYNPTKLSEYDAIWNYMHPDQVRTYEFWSRYPV